MLLQPPLWEEGVLMILNVADDEISNNFVLCCCKLVFNDGKVFALFAQIVCYIST